MIHVSDVSKEFLLPHERRTTFREYFLHFFHPIHYERFYALRNVSFDLPKGQWLGIVGENGSGKSTLLRILAGVFTPTEGSVQISGKIVPLLGLGVGFHPDLTVCQNIFLNGALLGISLKKLKKKQKDILDFAEITLFRDAKLKNLSSGMIMRLAFSIALQTEGDIFLLDEILAVGDRPFQKKCETLFRTLKKEGKTVVLVSHNLNFLREWCDEMIWLHHGEIVAQGLPEVVLSQYEKK